MSSLDTLLQELIESHHGHEIAIHVFDVLSIDTGLLLHLIEMGHCPRFTPRQTPVSHRGRNYLLFVYDLSDVIQSAYYGEFCHEIGHTVGLKRILSSVS